MAGFKKQCALTFLPSLDWDKAWALGEEAFACPTSDPAGSPRVTVLQNSLSSYAGRAGIYLMASDYFSLFPSWFR